WPGPVPGGAGRVEFALRDGTVVNILELSEAAHRKLARSDWGIVRQDPRDGLRLGVSAGANVGEPLMALGARHYGRVRATALEWLDKGEIGVDRIDDLPETVCGGMPQRLPIAGNLLTQPAPV